MKTKVAQLGAEEKYFGDMCFVSQKFKSSRHEICKKSRRFFWVVSSPLSYPETVFLNHVIITALFHL